MTPDGAGSGCAWSGPSVSVRPGSAGAGQLLLHRPQHASPLQPGESRGGCARAINRYVLGAAAREGLAP